MLCNGKHGDGNIIFTKFTRALRFPFIITKLDVQTADYKRSTLSELMHRLYM